MSIYEYTAANILGSADADDTSSSDENIIKPADILKDAHTRMYDNLRPLYNSMLRAGLVKQIQRLQLASQRNSGTQKNIKSK